VIVAQLSGDCSPETETLLTQKVNLPTACFAGQSTKYR
jgi:hypothetical protein